MTWQDIARGVARRVLVPIAVGATGALVDAGILGGRAGEALLALLLGLSGS